MNRTVTMRMSSVLLAALAALALVVAYLLGAAGGDRGSARAAEGPAAVASGDQGARVIRMVGRGEASAVPDELTFGLVVTVKRDDLDAALADSSATMKSVLAELAAYGVTKTDVQTTGLSMNPEYDYHSDGPPTLTGYRVSQQARVDVTDLTKAGAAITAAVAAGGNDVRVDNIRLQISDPDQVLAQARDAAVEEATAKAEQYAAATGQQLGEVLSIKEVSVSAPAPQEVFGRAALDRLAAKAVPIRAGESDLSVRVQVEWSFE